MKKIFIFVSVFFFIFISGCSDKTIKIKLNEDVDLKSFMTYDFDYEIQKNESFNFPQLERNSYIQEETVKENEYIIYTKVVNSISFYGWEDQNNKLYDSNSINIKSDSIFTPKYNISSNRYSVKLITNGIEVTPSNSQDINNFILPTIENTNYSFGGWFYNELYVGKALESIQYSQLDEELVLYAKLTPTIEYVNNLINNLPNDLQDKILDYNEKFELYNSQI